MGGLPIVFGAAATGSKAHRQRKGLRRIAYEDGRRPLIRNPSSERNREASSAKDNLGAKRANSRANSSEGPASPSSAATQPLFSAHSISTAVSPTNQTSAPAGTPLGARARW